MNKRYYRARAVGPEAVTFGRSRNGNEQVAVPFTVIDGPETGKALTWVGTFTADSEEITLRALRTAGWVGDELFDMAGIGDKDVDLVVEDEEWEGKVRERVKWVNEPGGGKFKFQVPVEGADLRALSARMKGAAVASRQQGSGPASGGRPAATSRNGGRPDIRGPERRAEPQTEVGAVDEIPF